MGLRELAWLEIEPAEEEEDAGAVVLEVAETLAHAPFLSHHASLSRHFPDEPEIHHRKPSESGAEIPAFRGGNLVMHEDRIELCGEEVGGTKGNALIRQILPHLARKTKGDRYIKASRGEIAAAIKADVMDSAIANAIHSHPIENG